MKLLLYSHFFAPSVGGVENIVRSLADGLSRRRTANGEPEFEVTVVTKTAGGDFDDNSLQFSVIRQPGALELWRQIRRTDVIHMAGPALVPLLLAWLAGRPAVLEHHGYQAICLNGLLLYQPPKTICPGHFQARKYAECLRCHSCDRGLIRSLVSLLLMFPRFWLSGHVAMNLAITQHVLERHALPRSAVIYYGIEDPWSKEACSYSTVRSLEKLCFAYVGRLVPEKGIPILLEAALTLKREGQSFEVLIIGDGPERSRLEAIIARDRLETCVRFTGMVTGTALADTLRDVHVMVMPSIWEETAGLAAIEQMLTGRMVIVSDIGGLGEIVGDAGLKFSPGRASDLAECMKRALQNSTLIGVIGSKARERALQLFARQRMLDEHASAYHKVLGKRTANSRSSARV